jgi:hypothetical protein
MALWEIHHRLYRRIRRRTRIMNGCKHEDSEEIRKAIYYYYPSAAGSKWIWKE